MSDDLSSPKFLQMVAEATARLEGLSPEQRAAEHSAWQADIAKSVPQTTGYNGPTVPERFIKARFDNFKPHTDSQKVALQLAERTVARISNGYAPRVAIIGNEGAGKSHLMYAMRWQLWEEHGLGVGHYSGTWPEIANRLRYGYTAVMPDGTSREVDSKDARHALYRADVVFIDEITPTAATDFDGTELKNFLTHCYDHKVAIVVTSNITPLSAVMGGPAADRFDQFTVVGPTRQERMRL